MTLSLAPGRLECPSRTGGGSRRACMCAPRPCSSSSAGRWGSSDPEQSLRPTHFRAALAITETFEPCCERFLPLVRGCLVEMPRIGFGHRRVGVKFGSPGESMFSSSSQSVMMRPFGRVWHQSRRFLNSPVLRRAGEHVRQTESMKSGSLG